MKLPHLPPQDNGHMSSELIKVMFVKDIVVRNLQTE